jgi:formylglycine-generating enzyme required for sulfatase activity
VGVSPLGCFDMSGNAEEWTAVDQRGNLVESDTGAIVNVVIRGGSYKSKAQHATCRSRWVTPMSPYEGKQPSSRPIGFRCVREAR